MSTTKYTLMSTAALLRCVAEQQKQTPVAMNTTWDALCFALIVSVLALAVGGPGLFLLAKGWSVLGGAMFWIGFAIFVAGYIPWLAAFSEQGKLVADMRSMNAELERRGLLPVKGCR